jgi:hypothetical protein
LIVGLAVAAGTFVVVAISFAVLDLYLAGHGRPSPLQQPFVMRGQIQLSVADAVALLVSGVTGVLAMVIYARRR